MIEHRSRDARLFAPAKPRRRGARLFSLLLHVLAHKEIIQPAQQQHRARQPEREAMILAFHQAFALAHLHPEPAKHPAPDRRQPQGRVEFVRVWRPFVFNWFPKYGF
jgi:hypothetical protein